MYTLFLTRGYPTDKYKRNGIFEFDQAKALALQGIKVVYAAVDIRSIRRWRKWGIHKEILDGVEIYSINIPLGRVSRKMRARVRLFGLKILYKKILKEQGKPDILHAHFTRFGYVGSKLKEEINLPLVLTEHSSRINKEEIDKDLKEPAKIAYKSADALIGVSPALVEVINKNFNIRPIYIPNIVDLSIFDYTKSIKNKKEIKNREKTEKVKVKKTENIRKDQSFNFVSTGNLIQIKRMDLTIKAFYKSFKDYPNVTLTIFGDGPKKKDLKEIINKYKLKEKVKLKGLSSREDIAREYEKSDCFVLPSRTETFGVAYIEALAMGLPVISTKCGGPEAFVDSESGILIEVDNEKELIESMKYMYENIDIYNKKSISNKTKNEFSGEVVAKKIIEVYKNLLDN